MNDYFDQRKQGSEFKRIWRKEMNAFKLAFSTLQRVASNMPILLGAYLIRMGTKLQGNKALSPRRPALNKDEPMSHQSLS